MADRMPDQEIKSMVYVENAIKSFVIDPADNQFQRGYLAALIVVYEEAFGVEDSPLVASVKRQTLT